MPFIRAFSDRRSVTGTCPRHPALDSVDAEYWQSRSRRDRDWTRRGRRLTIPTFHERIVLQTIPAEAISNRFHHSQFEGAGGAGREQDRFQRSRGSLPSTARAKAFTRARSRAGWRGLAACSSSNWTRLFRAICERQFADDPRVHVINRDAASLPEELHRRGIDSAITSSPEFRSAFWRSRRSARFCRKPTMRSRHGGAFIIYQVTNELKQHATFFDHAESEYCLQNIPPMFITVFQKANAPQRPRPQHGLGPCGSLGQRRPA